ncbi:MAG: hypothetical protein K8F91_20960 [Candidatus Obscuribacterales bacterium]|nr:hypothetical protein [Candidatus Obscuribacterales bacterium]
MTMKMTAELQVMSDLFEMFEAMEDLIDRRQAQSITANENWRLHRIGRSVSRHKLRLGSKLGYWCKHYVDDDCTQCSDEKENGA